MRRNEEDWIQHTKISKIVYVTIRSACFCFTIRFVFVVTINSSRRLIQHCWILSVSISGDIKLWKFLNTRYCIMKGTEYKLCSVKDNKQSNIHYYELIVAITAYEYWKWNIPTLKWLTYHMYQYLWITPCSRGQCIRMYETYEHL